MVTAFIIAGVLLFGLGAATDHLSGRAERDFPPDGQFVTAGGLKQHVLIQGDGAHALVMIHGAYGSAGDFAASLMPALSPHFRCIAVDRPGQGYTERGGDDSASPAIQARYLHAALQALGVRRPLLLGFSFGGAVALAYALAYRDEVAGLVLINPASHPWRRGEPLPFGIADAPLVGPVLRNTVVTPLGFLLQDRVVADVFAPSPVPPAFAQAPVELALRPGSYAANAADIRSLNDFLRRQAPQYPSLRLPVEIVANRNDRSVSAAIHAEALAREIPGADLLLTDSGGHPLHFSQPELVLQAIGRAEARAGFTTPLPQPAAMSAR